jgi:hypothetical protein
LLGKQSLRRNATTRPTRFIDATLDNDLASIGKPNTHYLGQMGGKKKNRHRAASQDAPTPPFNPGRQI